MKKSKLFRSGYPIYVGEDISPQAQSEKILAELKEISRLLKFILERLDK